MFAILYSALYKASVIKTGIHVRHLAFRFIRGIRYQNGHTLSPSCILLYKASVIKTGIHVRRLVFRCIQGIRYQNGHTGSPSCILVYTRHPLLKRAYTFTILYSFIQGFRYQNGHTRSASCIPLYTRHPLSKRAYMFAILYSALYKASVIKTGRHVRHLAFRFIRGIRYQNGHTGSPSCILVYTRHPLSKRAYTFILYSFIKGLRYQNGHTRSASCIMLIHCTRYHIRGHTGRRAVLFRRHETRVQERRAEGYR